MITKSELDELVLKYENEDFIKDDPVQFIHRFKEKKDIELAGFIASLLAYGSRKQFIRKLDNLFINIAQNEPLNFILNFEPKLIGDFNYRFGKPYDFISIFEILSDTVTNKTKCLKPLRIIFIQEQINLSGKGFTI